MKLIDANKFNNFDYSAFDGHLTEDAVGGIETVLRAIDETEEAVIRCKNCEHYLPDRNDKTIGSCKYFSYYSYAPEVEEDDYCSRGEKK